MRALRADAASRSCHSEPPERSGDGEESPAHGAILVLFGGDSSPCFAGSE
jgi:hypothetical protein